MKKGCSNVLGHWAIVFACATLLPCMAFAESIEDKLLRFSTIGPDRYADGSVVADGECYALVWSPEGTAFSGFNADGSAISADDRIVLAAALALNGKCRDSVFQVPAEEYEELKGGEWSVCLVDTRMANGVPAGVKDNAPLRVNRWGAVNSGVKIEPASASAQTLAAIKPKTGARRLMAAAPDAEEEDVEEEGDGGAFAGNVSAVPASVKPPRITRLDVLNSGKVWLEVADTVPFLSYTIVSGSTPGNLQEDICSEVVDGRSGAKISIETAQSESCRFFKVIRAE